MGLVLFYLSKGDLKKLEPVLLEAEQISLAKRGPDHTNTARATSALASLYFLWRDYPRSERYHRDYRKYLLTKAPDEPERFVVESRLGACLLEQKKYAESESLLLSAWDGMKGREACAPLSKQPEARRLLELIVRLYGELGKKGEADEWKNRFEDLVFPADAFVPL